MAGDLRATMIELPDAAVVERRVADLRLTSPDFAALLERYGDATMALRHVGVLLWQARRYDDAAETLRCALALTPGDASLWRDLAGAHEGGGDDTRALGCITRAIGLAPGAGLSWLMRAGVEARSGDVGDAEASYRRALDLDPALVDAHVGLGLLCIGQQRFDEATSRLRVAVQYDAGHALAQRCLGHALYATGDFVASAAAFEAGAFKAGAFEAGKSSAPLDDAERRTYAYARTLRTMIEGRVQEALDAYPAIAGTDAADLATVAQDAFALLGAFGYAAAASDIGRLLLARDPSDAVRRYALAAVSGATLDRAPADYVERYFDRFAPNFDRQLVGALGYRVPERLVGLIAAHRDAFGAILDLGCGTGLAAAHLARFGGRLTGLDLSARMLDEARKRERYAELTKGDAVAFLQSASARFDLVFAADLLVYLGDLAPVFEGVADRLMAGGMFALSIETTASGSYALLPSGRFAHAPAYVERLALECFGVADTVDAVIRLEGRRPVEGRLFVLQRR